MLGFETIGNATMIVHDRCPMLVTDPWLMGSAYFGSWTLSHDIPQEQMDNIRQCRYVWLSHGHPDHLNFETLDLLRDKKVLLSNHAGNRIAIALRRLGYDVSTLSDRTWFPLSDRVRIQTLADYNQDSILMVDIGGRLVVNLNDAGDCGWGPYVRKLVKQYDITFLLRQTGSVDVDMNNFFDEHGTRIVPFVMPVGFYISVSMRRYGCRYFVPFSSMHAFQRRDSMWVQPYSADLSDYRTGFDPDAGELLPAYIRYDCELDTVKEINPPRRQICPRDPIEFGDDWAAPLDPGDRPVLERYFHSIAHLADYFDFINIRVGNTDNTIGLGGDKTGAGITFEVPRHSLMLAVRNETFDDLLIGNFMKTTLHGGAAAQGLYPHFSPYVAKYADNGGAKSKAELKKYFREYRRRSPYDFLRHRIAQRSVHAIRPALKPDGLLNRFIMREWYPD